MSTRFEFEFEHRLQPVRDGPTTARQSRRQLQPDRDGPTTARQSRRQLQPDRDVTTTTRQSRRQLMLMQKQPYHDRNATESDSDVDVGQSRWRHKLEYLKDMIIGVDLLIVAAVASIITFGVSRLGSESEWMSFISASKPATSMLGAFYSFALVFRTNICYSRWWEGRILWGSMIVCSIRIARQAHLWIKEPALVHRLSCLAVIFAYCSKAQLRGAGVEDVTESGAELLEKGVISQEELDMISRQSGWQAFYCIDAMRAVVSSGLEGEGKGDSKHDGWKNNAAQTAMEETICKLADGIGGCIRVLEMIKSLTLSFLT